MNLILELFIVRLLPERVRYWRSETVLADADVAPDRVVRDIVEGRAPGSPVRAKRYLSHSTSWRYDPCGAVVLTYLVSIDNQEVGGGDQGLWRELHAADLNLACSEDPCLPQPQRLTERHVLSHAIRHLAFLWRDGKDKTVRQILGADAAVLFAKAAPALAGCITCGQ
jgi:hypothetical protein